MDRDEVNGEHYVNAPRKIVASSDGTTEARMYFRNEPWVPGGRAEAPWISLHNHPADVLYGEASSSAHHTQYIGQNGGILVLVRETSPTPSPTSLQKTAVNKGGSGCTSSAKCGACEGDCDNDSDCGSGLKCFQTETGAHPPGCNTGGNPNTYDWCYDPDWRLPATDLGSSGCTSSEKCGMCEGDCDYDSDCAEGLKCFQTETGELPPGCDTS